MLQTRKSEVPECYRQENPRSSSVWSPIEPESVVVVMRRERPESVRNVLQSRSRWWSVTIFGKVGSEEVPDQPTLDLTANGLLYYKFQLELCPTTNRRHFQGCLRYDRPVSMAQVKQFIAVPHAHLEIVRDVQAMRDYCGKEETRIDGPWEGGDPGNQGKRSDLQEVTDLIKSGGTLEEVAERRPDVIIRYGRGVQSLHELMNKPKYRPNLKVYLLWGPTGVGKTEVARRVNRVIDPSVGDDLAAISDLAHPWFDGYRGTKVLLLDECGEGMMCINRFKLCLDKYPVKMPIKGGFVPVNADVIFCTSNTPITDWWPRCKVEDILAIERRFHRVFNVTSFAESDRAFEVIMQDLNPDPLPIDATEVVLELPAGRPRPPVTLLRGVLSTAGTSCDVEGHHIADVLSDSESDAESMSSQGAAAASLRAAEFLDLSGPE